LAETGENTGFWKGSKKRLNSKKSRELTGEGKLKNSRRDGKGGVSRSKKKKKKRVGKEYTIKAKQDESEENQAIVEAGRPNR